MTKVTNPEQAASRGPQQAESVPAAEGAAVAPAGLPVDAQGEIVLPVEWQKVQSAIWLLGLVVLAVTGWWWPGILVLVAISGLTQAAIGVWVQRGREQAQAAADAATLARLRAAALPPNCPSCGAALDAGKVAWRSDTTAACPYCTASIPVVIRG
jgi:hypothetical protein